jgi:hypothetical protein
VKKYALWKNSEIELLSKAYFSGERIKTIARHMGRTESSVNRALDRHKIRILKSHGPIISSLPPTKGEPKRTYHKETTKLPPQEMIVSMATILKWMNCENYQIETATESIFVVNGIPKTAGQLLLECNRRRIIQKLPLYYVEGVCD